MAKAELDVVVVGYNGRTLLPVSLAPLLSLNEPSFQLIYVDNGSSDGSCDYVEETFPRSVIIRNPINLGFARANNQGIETGEAPAVLLLNSDLFISPDAIGSLWKALTSDSDIGSVAPKIYRISREDFLKIPTTGENRGRENQGSVISSKILDSTGHILYRDLFARNRGRDQVDVGQYDSSLEPFGVSAACAIYRRTALEEAKLNREVFDSSFFSYYEDVDLDIRLKMLGWRSRYLPFAVAYHIGAASRLAGTAMIQVEGAKNRHLMMLKYLPISYLILNFPSLIVAELFNFAYLLLRQPWGLFSLPRLISVAPQALRSRRVIKKSGKYDINRLLPHLVSGRKRQILRRLFKLSRDEDS